MKIIVAPDSFKESLSAEKVAESIASGILKAVPNAVIEQIPVSDGGEGLLKALVKPYGGRLISAEVLDPLQKKITAHFGLLNDKKTAVIEMANASGLELINSEERNPLITTTYGTGQLIKAALDKGCSKIIVGLGGSATNDGGVGMVQALGGKFLDKDGNEIGFGGANLQELHTINLDQLDIRLNNCTIIGACDVTNPLTGKNGASMIYGKQKGASPGQQLQLDNALTHYANIVRKQWNIEIDTVNGAGAAGGTGAALIGFLQAQLIPGIELITDQLNLEEKIANADLVITGEGKIDQQTLNGKTISGIAKIAKKHHVPVIVIAGSLGENLNKLYEIGISAIFSIVDHPMSLENALKNSDQLLQRCSENIIRALTIKT